MRDILKLGVGLAAVAFYLSFFIGVGLGAAWTVIKALFSL